MGRSFTSMRVCGLVSGLLLLLGCNSDGSGGQPLEPGMFGPGGYGNGVPVDGGTALGPNGPQPDLSVSELLAPNTVLLGSALLMDLTVRNGGPGIAPVNTPWKLYRETVDGMVQVGAGNLQRIDSGAQQKLAVEFEAKGVPLGELVLCFVIDPTNLVDETDETNNQTEVKVQVVQAIDN